MSSQAGLPRSLPALSYPSICSCDEQAGSLLVIGSRFTPSPYVKEKDIS
jgi:hypothetical protein